MSCSSVPARWRFFIATLLVIAAASAAEAQTDPGWFRYGPLTMTPSIALNNFGQDGNVFNEPENPKQDLTASIQPARCGDVHGARHLSGRVAPTR
jgi:hypothetical protein